MKKIPLSGRKGAGKYAIVDDEDFWWLSSRKWYLDTYGYAMTRHYIGRVDGKPVCQNLKMHRLVAMMPTGATTDHIDPTNRLDNRRANLRTCDKRENALNSLLARDNTSGYRGVNFDKSRDTWRAYTNFYGQQILIGRYDTKEEAAYIYDQVVLQIHGEEYPQLNILDKDQ